jgi:hypothetical protein
MFLTVVVPWAQETNFSTAGAWDGTPTKVAPVGDIFTPNTKPAAQFFNYLFNAYSVALANVQAYAVAGGLQNWGSEFQLNAGTTQLAVAWDPANFRWLMLSNTTGPGAVRLDATKGLDGGTAAAWTNLAAFGTANPALYGACCLDPVTFTQQFLTYTDSGATHNNLTIWQDVAGTWTDVFNATSAGYFYGVEIATLGTGVAVAVASTDGHSGILWTTNSVGGGWPAFAWPPATQFQPFGIAAMNAGDTVYLKSNGTQMLCIPSTTAAGGYTVWQTTNLGASGGGWTSSASLAGITAAGKVVGLCWTQDAVGLCWLVAVEYTGGGPTRFYRSSDGVLWTAQAGGISAVVTVVDMASAGSHVKCTLKDTSSGGPSFAMFSPDGGVTWWSDQQSFTSNSTPLGQDRSRLASSTNGFMAMNGLWVRFSDYQGLPATPL